MIPPTTKKANRPACVEGRLAAIRSPGCRPASIRTPAISATSTPNPADQKRPLSRPDMMPLGRIPRVLIPSGSVNQQIPNTRMISRLLARPTIKRGAVWWLFRRAASHSIIRMAATESPTVFSLIRSVSNPISSMRYRCIIGHTSGQRSRSPAEVWPC